jgi:hypothetical protein
MLTTTLLTIMACAMSWPILGMVAEFRSRRGIRSTAETVARDGNVQTIGALLDVLSLDDPPSRVVAVRALNRLLPTLKASDGVVLTGAQRQRLTYYLSRGVENPLYKNTAEVFHPADGQAVDLRVAILKAFEQIGDSRSLSYVEKLAAGSGRTAGQRRVKQAAMDCLPFAQQLAAKDRESHSLLRPSGDGIDTDQMLLRPASNAQASAEDLLLRAQDEPDLRQTL